MLIDKPTVKEHLVFLSPRDLVQFNFSPWGLFLPTTTQIIARELSLCSLCVVIIMEMTIRQKHLSVLVFMALISTSYRVDCVSTSNIYQTLNLPYTMCKQECKLQTKTLSGPSTSLQSIRESAPDVKFALANKQPTLLGLMARACNSSSWGEHRHEFEANFGHRISSLPKVVSTRKANHLCWCQWQVSSP